jgi:glyoxylase-like metal-dependent hydrolase (beta-lactamase superfamily II)
MHPAEQVAEGIYQVQLPLPFALRIVNCYLLRGGDGWTVIDCGLHTPEGEAAWLSAFAALHIQPGDVRQIVVTHHHPDHYGMAGWLSAWNGTPPLMYTSAPERQMIELVWWNLPEMHVHFGTLMRQAGVDAALLETMLTVSRDIQEKTLPHALDFTILAEGDVLHAGGRALRMILGKGHSVGQTLLYDEADGLLFSADHILMKITPNVGIWHGGLENPLEDFLHSLATLRALDVQLALPGHKTQITDWRGRIEALAQHHEERLAHIAQAVRGGKTALEVAQAIFHFHLFTPHEMRFAVAEALAHLEYARLRGDYARDERDGVWVYGG